MSTAGREAAMKRVSHLEDQLQAWNAAAARAAVAVEDVRAEMGSAVVEDPKASAGFVAKLATASSELDVAEAAASAVGPKLFEAKLDVLRADAAAFDEEASSARKKLEIHQRRTDELLAALAEHEGQFAPATREVVVDGQVLALVPVDGLKSDEFRRAAEIAELRAAMLRAVLAGEDPRALVDPLRSIQDGSVLGVSAGAIWPYTIAPGRELVRFTDIVRASAAA